MRHAACDKPASRLSALVTLAGETDSSSHRCVRLLDTSRIAAKSSSSSSELVISLTVSRILSQHILLRGSLLGHPHRPVLSLLPQRNENPEPGDHLHKCPCEKNPILQSLTPGTWRILFRSIQRRGIGEEVGVEGYTHEKEKPYGRC